MPQTLTTVIPELDNAAIRRTSTGQCSVYDLIEVIGGLKNPKKAWKQLTERYPEVVAKCQNFKFPGKGQASTPVTNREGWVYIINLLPGVIGQQYRESSAHLVLRYLDADITLAEEVVERNDNEADLEQLEVRIRTKKVRNHLTRILQTRGVKPGLEFAVCTNKTYSGLYGTNAAGLRKIKRLPPKANVREHMNTAELIEVSFAESLSARKLDQEAVNGFEQCSSLCYATAKSVADFVRDTLGSQISGAAEQGS